MAVQEVESSLIKSLERDGESVTVTFKSNGARYRYDGVTDQEYGDWIGSASVGGYFLANIKKSKTCTKV